MFCEPVTLALRWHPLLTIKLSKTDTLNARTKLQMWHLFRSIYVLDGPYLSRSSIYQLPSVVVSECKSYITRLTKC